MLLLKKFLILQTRGAFPAICMPILAMDDFRLRIFMTVAECGSFTKAAGKLGISQPAVSQNIADLEQDTGIRLFVRDRRNVSLTPEGILFRSYAEKILYWCDAAGRMFGAGIRKSRMRTVRIAASEDVASCILPDLVSSVRTVIPDMNFEVTDFQGMPGSAPDLAIVTERYQDRFDFETSGRKNLAGGNYTATPIGMPAACAVASSSGPLAFSSLREIPDTASIAYWSGPGPAKDILPMDMLPNIRFESFSVEAVKTAVRRSANIAGILPYHAVKRELEAGEFVQLPLPAPPYMMTAELIIRDEFGRTSVGKLLSEKLKTYF